jgi:PAS domain S-box-containing protein
MTEPIDYRSVLRATPDLYLIISPALQILDASNAYLDATMVKREAILGRYLFDVFPDNPNDPSATGASNLNRSIQAVLKTKTPNAMPVQKYDIRRPMAEGGEFEERFWCPLNTPVLDKNKEIKYIIHRVEDVTEINRIRQSGIETSRRLQLLVESIKEYAIIMLDSKGFITTWNAGAELIIGYSAEDVIGKPGSILFPQEAYKHVEYELNSAKKNGRYEEQGWRLRKNGTKFWAGITVSPIYVKSHYDHKNHLIGYAMVLRDLTHQKEVETVKQELISVVNHELRTPLTSIFGAMRLLSNWSEQLPQKNNYLLEIANANCDRLLLLINDMLDIEKLAAGGKSLHFQVIELTSLVAHAISINQGYGARYGVEISFVPLDGEAYVDVDSSRLIQVITNLISNAIKFSEGTDPVCVSMSQIGSAVRVAVTNHGKGIPEGFKDKLFEKFSQADVSTTRVENGTGLGLAISKDIIKCFGSTIKFTSVPNGETTFYFDLEVIEG